MKSKSEKPYRHLQRILVTGGAGFIGSHTVDLLLSQGKEVVVLDNLSSGKLENLDLRHPNLEFLEGDVLEFPLLEELIAQCDAVLHLAAMVSVPLTIENPILSLQVNTQGLLHVLQAVNKTNSTVRVVQASSAAVYGNTKALPCREDSALPAVPLSNYALQKIHAEDYAKLYLQLYGIEGLALRYFNVYGARQDPHSPYSGVISRFIEAYKNEKPLTIFGDGQQSRDFIHVSDVAKANVLALQSDYTGVLNIATGRPCTLLQLIDDIAQVGAKVPQLQFSAPRLGDIKESYAATDLAKAALGFESSVSVKEGMRILLDQVHSSN
jgi:UDP-glucose 4-epimerase